MLAVARFVVGSAARSVLVENGFGEYLGEEGVSTSDPDDTGDGPWFHRQREQPRCRRCSQQPWIWSLEWKLMRPETSEERPSWASD